MAPAALMVLPALTAPMSSAARQTTQTIRLTPSVQWPRRRREPAPLRLRTSGRMPGPRPYPHSIGSRRRAGGSPGRVRNADCRPMPSRMRLWRGLPGPGWPSPPTMPLVHSSATWARARRSPGSSTRPWTARDHRCRHHDRRSLPAATRPRPAPPGAERPPAGRPDSPAWISAVSSMPWRDSAAASSCPPTRGGPSAWTISNIRPTAYGFAGTRRCCHRSVMRGMRVVRTLRAMRIVRASRRGGHPSAPCALGPTSWPPVPALDGPWLWWGRGPPPITGSAWPPGSPQT